MFQRQSVQHPTTVVILTVAATLAPWIQSVAQDSDVVQRVARRRQDLPPPEFEEVLTAPADEIIHSPPSPVEVAVDSAVEGGVVSGTPGVWDDDGLKLGSDFSEPHHLDDPDGPLIHDMPLLQNSGTWLWRGHWYTEQSLVLMYRSMANGKILTRDQTYTQRTQGFGQSLVTQGADNQDPLQTDGQTFRTEPGVKLTIGNIIGRDVYNRDHAIEFTFWGFFDFDGRDRITASQGPGLDDGDFNVLDLGGFVFRLDGLLLDAEVGPTSGIFQLPISVVGFSNALTHSYLYESDLNSFEFNLKKRSRLRRDRVLLQPNGSWHRDINSGSILTLLGGLRMVRHNERFLWDSFGAADSQQLVARVDNYNNLIAIDSPGGNTGRGSYEVRTHNDMVGIQMGAGLLQQHANWHWGIKVLAGTLHNFANRKIDINVTDMGLSTSFGDDAQDEQLAFLGETGAYVGWQIRPHVALKASYDLLYYTGVVLARDGIEINGENARQTTERTDPNEITRIFEPATISGTFRPLEVRGDALYHAISAGFEIVW